MNPSETKEEYSQTEAEILAFIMNNIHDDSLLTDYFSNLNRSLTPATLTLNMSSNHDQALGEKECNFLGYAGFFSKPYFKYLVQLATPDALNAALLEDPVNPNSETALHSILDEANHQTQAILEVIQKAGVKEISEASLKLCFGRNPFFMALGRQDHAIACALIHKMDKDSLNQASKIFYSGVPIIEGIVNRKYHQMVVATLLDHLKSETIDFLMLTAGPGGWTPLHRLVQNKRHKKQNEPLICLLVSHTSPATLYAIAKQNFHQIKVNLISMLVTKQASTAVIDAIFSRLDKNDLNHLFLNSESFLGLSPLYTASQRSRTFLDLAPTDLTKEINPTMMAMVKHLDKNTIKSTIETPFDLKTFHKTLTAIAPPGGGMVGVLNKMEEEMKLDSATKLFNAQFQFLKSCANNPPALNEMVAKMLLEDERITLPIKALYSLSKDNLVGYLAQNPDMCVDVKKIEHAYSILFDWQYRQEFEKRLTEANSILQKIINFSLAAFHELKYVHLPDSLARIAYSYLPIGIRDVNVSEEGIEMMQENRAIVNRVDFEMTKKEFADDIVESTPIYPQLDQCFSHMEHLAYSQDEAALVLSYLVKYPRIVDVAVANCKTEKANSLETDKPKSESLLATVSCFFGKKEAPKVPSKPMECLKKLETAKQAISNFVQSENRVLEEKQENNLGKPRTLAQLKAFYQEKNNEKRLSQIKSLEADFELANTQYKEESLKLIIKVFGNTATKTSWKSVKKIYQTRQLQQEAKQFGYDCRDTQHDGNCFFHAVVDQLTLQGLSILGSDPQELRATAMNYILNHLDDYKSFLDEHYGDINEFIGQNIDMGTWADHLIISALSRALNINFVIIRSDGAAPTIFKHTQPIATLYLGHEVGQHYQSLIENKLIPKTKWIKPYMDSAVFESPNEVISSSQSEDELDLRMQFA
jgi:hypothetical protein